MDLFVLFSLNAQDIIPFNVPVAVHRHLQGRVAADDLLVLGRPSSRFMALASIMPSGFSML